MWKIIIPVIALFVSLIVVSSLGAKDIHAPAQTKPYTIKTLKKTSEACLVDKDAPSYATLNIQYPYFESSVGQYSANELNEMIQKEYIVYTAYDDSTAKGIDDFANLFFKDFEEFCRGNEFASADWELNKTINVSFLSKTVLSFDDNTDSYTGGAHGFSQIIWHSYDIQKHKKLSLDDVLLADSKDRFRKLAEHYFRKFHELSEDTNLAEAGFEFPDNKFALSDNFALLKRGIMIYYNSYDIAAYVVGPTELLIPYTDLEGMLRPRYLPLKD